MTTSSRVREHLRTNVVGYIALFCFAMAGTASALPGRNSVEANDIAKNAVKKKQINEDKLDYAQIQARVNGECTSGEAIQVVNESGSVVCGDVGGSTPTGPAGNGLAGTYPNPSIASNAVGALQLQNNAVVGGGGGDIMDNTIDSQDVLDAGGGTLVGADINESQLDFPGRSTIDGTCNDDDQDGEDCATQAVTLARSARVLLVASGTANATAIDDAVGPGSGTDDINFVDGNCQFRIDGTNQGNPQEATLFHINQQVGLGGTMVTGVLTAGLHTFVWRCDEDDGDIDFNNTSISAVVLSAT